MVSSNTKVWHNDYRLTTCMCLLVAGPSCKVQWFDSISFVHASDHLWEIQNADFHAWPSSPYCSIARNVTAWPASRPGYEIHGNSVKIDQKSHPGRSQCGWAGLIGPCYMYWAMIRAKASEKTKDKKDGHCSWMQSAEVWGFARDEEMRACLCLPRLFSSFRIGRTRVVEVQLTDGPALSFQLLPLLLPPFYSSTLLFVAVI